MSNKTVQSIVTQKTKATKQVDLQGKSTYFPNNTDDENRKRTIKGQAHRVQQALNATNTELQKLLNML